MDTRGEGQCDNNSPTHCLVEEEYTIAVPLVRPKPSFLDVLRLAGATHEVFTRNEILHFLKRYIISRKMFDIVNPSIVHCQDDLLGDVFGVPEFTISDVLNLLAKNCTQLPDTCLQRRRRLASKPSQNSTIRTSINTSDGAVAPLTSSVITSTTSNKPSSIPHNIPHTQSRKSSSSSSGCDRVDGTDIIELGAINIESHHKILKGSESVSGNDHDQSSANEKGNSQDQISANGNGNSQDQISANGNGNSQDQISANGNSQDQISANGIGNYPCHSSSNQSNNSSEGEKSTGSRRRKRKKNSSPKEDSGRKRHHTEPSCVAVLRESSQRKRGTSLSIAYGNDGDNGRYPWYFQLELGDSLSDDGESEVLSVQDKETVIVQDSTDDLWFLEEDSIAVEVPSDTDFSIEYDVESDISPVTESDLSSVCSAEGGFLVVCKESDVEFFADCSDSDSNQGDKELSEADNWCCSACEQINPPVQRYCSKCWKLRADWLKSQHADDLDRKNTGHKSGFKGENEKHNKSAIEFCIEQYGGTVDQAIVGLGREKDKGLQLFGAVKHLSKDQTDSGLGNLSSTMPSSQETVVSNISLTKNDSGFYEKTDQKSLETPALVATWLNNSVMHESHGMESRYSFSNVQLKDGSVTSPGSQSAKSADDFVFDNKDVKVASDAKVAGPTVDDPCMICLSRPKIASLIHGSSGHQVCCFTCAKRLKRRGKLCPVCRRPIQKVVKNYYL